MKKRRALSFLAVLAVVLSLVTYASHPKVSAASGGAGLQNSSITQQAITDITNAATIDDLKTADQHFLDQYGMTVSFDCPTQAQAKGDLCTSVTSGGFSAMQTTSRMFVEELSKLNPILTQNFTDHMYYIVGDFQLNVGSGSTKALAGVFDKDFGGPLIKQATSRSTILHEFYHYLEYETFGQNGPSDPSWTNFNPAGFSYVSGTCIDGEPGCQGGTHPINGFATGYAETNIIEDKAETFTYLMESKDYKNLSTWLTTDSLLTGKIGVMKTFLAGLDPAMDGAYFTNIHAFAAGNYSYNGFVAGYQLVTGDKSATDFDVAEGDLLVLDGQGHSVTVEPGGTLKGTGTLASNLSVNVNGIVAPGHSPGCLTVGDFFLSGTYQAEIGGKTACTSYDQLKATIGVTLTTTRFSETTNGILSAKLYGGFVPDVGDKYTIIDNQSANPVTGQFEGIPEGGTYISDGVTYRVSYIGGDGNDVVLTVTAVDQAVARAASPKAPNTGFALIKSKFELQTIATIVSASTLLLISRRMRRLA